MAERYLVGVDDSDGSQRAIDFAAGRAKCSNAELVLIYVIEWSPYSFMTPEELELRHRQRESEISQATTQILNPALQAVRALGLKAEGRVQHGHAAKVICEIAQEVDATQVFVGRQGISNVKAMLFGSISGSLVQISQVPVTVVP